MLRILYWAQGDDLVGPPQTSHDKKEKNHPLFQIVYLIKILIDLYAFMKLKK